MAYDKIIVIHSRLDRCLDYVQNDGKTDLGNAVDYICDPVKAGFQTAINCTLDKSFLQMQETKRRWDKHGGILGYHMLMCEERRKVSGRTLPALINLIRSAMRETAVSSLSLKHP